jgi:uncharacterized protein (DUF1015 family)
MRIQPFQALYPNFDFIASPDSFCEDARYAFTEFKQHGFFEKAPQDALYIYQIEAKGRLHTGLIGLNEIADFNEGRIKKHEKTLSEKEQQQMQLFLKWDAVLKPVLLAYKPVPEIQAWIQGCISRRKPLYETVFEKDGQKHRVWSVSDGKEIKYLQDLFADHIPRSYIADGHHRTTTVALLNERLAEKHNDFDFAHLFSAWFSMDELVILDFNRVIDALEDTSITRFIISLSEVCELKVLNAPTKPSMKHEMTMYLEGEWYALKWRKEILEQYTDQIALDAQLLNELIIDKIIGITDVRNDTRIAYVEGARGTQGIIKDAGKSKNKVSFMLYPVAFEDMMEMADQDMSLPPKSTYFEPRIKSGMLVKLLRTGA